MVVISEDLQTKPVTIGIREMATECGEEMLAKVIARHKSAGQYVTGQTSGTLRVEQTQEGFAVMGWKYAGTYQEGRKPGKQPPTSAILAWVQAKGLHFDKPGQAEHYAYAIARKIGQMGTKRFISPVDIWDTPIREMRADLAQLSTKYLEAKVARELLRIDLKRQ